MVFSRDDDDGEPIHVQSQAEIVLKQLLDKQLSTAMRFEQIEFEKRKLTPAGHGVSGISTLQEFVKTKLAQKQLPEKTGLLANALDGMGYDKARIQEKCQRINHANSLAEISSDKGAKRRHYGADPLFLLHSEVEDHQMSSLECKCLRKDVINGSLEQTNLPQDSMELDTLLSKKKDRAQSISHLTTTAISCRKSLHGLAGLIDQQLIMTPQDRARCSSEIDNLRLTDEVFSKPAPQVLDLHAYLKQRSELEPDLPLSFSNETVRMCEERNPSNADDHQNFVTQVPEVDIVRNRLSQEEIRKLPSGKFVNYLPGNHSNILYIKNLSKDVTEADLGALFLRYQEKDHPLLFRLMKRGRMKGQAFITFADEKTSMEALHLLNGYNLRGKPMVIEFGRANFTSSCSAGQTSDQSLKAVT